MVCSRANFTFYFSSFSFNGDSEAAIPECTSPICSDKRVNKTFAGIRIKIAVAHELACGQ